VIDADEDQLEPTPPRRPFAGWGSAGARGLSVAATGLVTVTSRLFGELRERSTVAASEFRARPEHARWRAYAFGTYGLIVATTLLGQLYTSNALAAYVRVQPVEMPASTQIFVRNDSRHTWKNLKLTLNGIYGYESLELKPGAHVLLPVNRFALYDGSGRPEYAPRNIAPKQLAIDCESGHFETELAP
jgi:hypothetical protein